MTSFVEHTPTIDGSQVKAGKHTGLKEDSWINGYVTVIKNVGKPDEQILCKDQHNLLTTDGRDFFHAQVYTNTSAGTRGANFIALTTDSSGADAGDTTLPSEITTGGLARAVATTITHTNDTNTTTLVKTFTASDKSSTSGLNNIGRIFCIAYGVPPPPTNLKHIK